MTPTINVSFLAVLNLVILEHTLYCLLLKNTVADPQHTRTLAHRSNRVEKIEANHLEVRTCQKWPRAATPIGL